jgi:predicted metalloprotease with PDZ domain
MSRSSPGRYALHEFAKNVLDVRVVDGAGRALTVTHPDPYGWDVPSHADTVRVMYRVFGDRVDGTYLAVDSTHAHINMPAALIWARGLEERAATVHFDRPQGTAWRVATQLLPGADDYTFNAPNLAYLMDSPTEVSEFALTSFTLGTGDTRSTFRLAVHHDGTPQELAAFTADVEKIVREARNVFGEYPVYEVPGRTYTFIADYLPWANGDGMEHRNSTIMTSPSSIRSNRLGLLDTAAHEFFHSWNMERIRSASLEPFDLERANMSGELWLGEGFTSYYGPLVLRRAGITSVDDFAADMGDTLNSLVVSPGRMVRSAKEMSELAPFVDAASAIDRTSFENTYVSYYTWGCGIALGLDLSLRTRTQGRVTLDHFMRELWNRYGKPGGPQPGVVARPYTMDDLKTTLAAVSGDEAFAREFFRRYVEGRELVDYQTLLAAGGIVLRRAAPGQPSAGAVRLIDSADGVRVAAATPLGSPLYQAGVDRDDVIVSIGGRPVATVAEWNAILQSHKPGDSLPIAFRRKGEQANAVLTVGEDLRVVAVPIERNGQTLTAAQRAFRDAWLNSPGDAR